jgi:hypothetical protein
VAREEAAFVAWAPDGQRIVAVFEEADGITTRLAVFDARNVSDTSGTKSR